MIGNKIKDLEEVEKYLRETGAYDLAAKVKEAATYLRDVWDELLRSAIERPEVK